MAKKPTTKVPEPKAEILTAPPKAPLQSSEIVKLTTNSDLVRRIETDIAKVETDELVAFYVRGEAIVKTITSLTKDAVRLELIRRREQGRPNGETNQHREFKFGDCKLQLEYRKQTPIDPVKARAILHPKGVWEDCIDLKVTEGIEELNAFLKKHRKELKDAGVVVVEEINKKKVDAMVALGKITADDVKGMLDMEQEPTYALKPKII